MPGFLFAGFSRLAEGKAGINPPFALTLAAERACGTGGEK